MELSEPKAKKRVRLQQQQPLPLIYNHKGELMIFTCHLNPHGTCIVNPEEMEIVNSMGFFGKGSLSRHYPSFGKFYYGAPPIIRHRQWKRRREWFDDVKKFSNQYLLEQDKAADQNGLSNSTQNSSPKNPNLDEPQEDSGDQNPPSPQQTTSKKSPSPPAKKSPSRKSNGVSSQDKDSSLEICEIADSSSDEEVCEIVAKESEGDSVKDLLDDSIEILCNEENQGESLNLQGKVLVLPDSDSDPEDYLKNVKPSIENEEFPVRETLHLTFEETFFLMYALGCLESVDSDGKVMSIRDVWDYCCKASRRFVPRYVVYHYFRSKGWVVKPGLKYGGDFLLYKDGPPFFHASYVVNVDENCKKEEESIHKKRWKNIFGLQRLSETASKETLIAQVIWPDSVSPNSVTPDHLSLFTVKEILLRRWVPGKNKSYSDDEYDDSL